MTCSATLPKRPSSSGSSRRMRPTSNVALHMFRRGSWRVQTRRRRGVGRDGVGKDDQSSHSGGRAKLPRLVSLCSIDSFWVVKDSFSVDLDTSLVSINLR